MTSVSKRKENLQRDLKNSDVSDPVPTNQSSIFYRFSLNVIMLFNPNRNLGVSSHA